MSERIERVYDRRRLADARYLGADVELVTRRERRRCARSRASDIVGPGRRGSLVVVVARVYWPAPTVDGGA
jgi:hypothetical protein